ncbi:hypothetical protein BD770DRAFT_448126 [Pilaira anomala]|nr:hypothetical protein BD770DRAFT_448126 [Pilaira anomala]
MFSKTYSYPNLILAFCEAGIFFNPIATKPSRIKCAYCGTTIDSPSDSLHLLTEYKKIKQ